MTVKHSQIRRRNGLDRAFTLVEILIVVVILGILASIIIPQFSNASHQARENTLKDDLRFLRTQIGVFAAQHRDVRPGYPAGDTTATPTEAAFVAQMTMFTSESCVTNGTGSSTYKFGPYLSKMPSNPLNGEASIMMVANGDPMPDVDGSTGWIYKPETNELLANLVGNDSNGTPYTNY